LRGESCRKNEDPVRPSIYNRCTGNPQLTMTKPKSEIAPAEEGFSLIPNRKLLAMYAAMLQCRRMAESSRQQSKTRSPADSILGCEAAAVGATFDLGPRDTVVPRLWPDAAFKAINPSVVVASGFALAARSALANKDNQQITLLFSSGKAGSQSSWLKALTVAAERDLPILFVSLERQANSRSHAKVVAIPLKKNGYAVPFISVDGNDVVAVYRVASEAITHARKGNGPTLIDCRLSPPDDPLENMKKYLVGKGLDPAILAPSVNPHFAKRRTRSQ
jgi:TPP-dependent pyruvate/acetoin dehydrogenase alpha subunit